MIAELVNDSHNVIVVSRNFDRSERRRWKAVLICYRPPLIELVGVFDQDIEHADLGFISKGTVSYEYYWLDRWYNVFRFHEPTGEFRNYYCNISVPPVFNDKTLEYVDLDIDIVVDGNSEIRVLDLEEFRENSSRFSIPDSIQASAYSALDSVLHLVRIREFPFDHF